MKRVKRKTKKKLFGFGPKIISTSETMYQKDMSSEELYSNLEKRYVLRRALF